MTIEDRPAEQVSIKPLHGGLMRRVPLADVRRFGRLARYCDARKRNVAELTNGEIVLCMQKDQTGEVVRMMRQRLEAARFDTYATRDCPEIFAWEAWQPCKRGNDVCPQGCCA